MRDVRLETSKGNARQGNAQNLAQARGGGEGRTGWVWNFDALLHKQLDSTGIALIGFSWLSYWYLTSSNQLLPTVYHDSGHSIN
jgi:hypothetical protein